MLLRNTMTRKKETFEPWAPGRVRMFTCGPSVYKPPHLGNFRTFLYEDVLQRYLEYRGFEVERVMNLTDVEDKSIRESEEKHVDLGALVDENIRAFRRDARALNIHVPEELPKASDNVDRAVEIIEALIKKGIAYWHDGDVYFDPLKYEGFGRLYGLDMSRWPDHKVRFHKDTYPGRRWNLGDFILWHGREGKDGDHGPLWDTAIGAGRPSWNIQDPAVITAHLGPQVDIATGGVDNLARHHDYNLAVMESSTGLPFARVWLHGEHLLVDGQKMSKSRGNIVTFADARRCGFEPEAVRCFLIRGHYRQPLNYTIERMNCCQGELLRLRNQIAALSRSGDGVPTEGRVGEIAEGMTQGFEERMDDDLDVAGAFAAVADGLSRLMAARDEMGAIARRDIEDVIARLRRIDSVLAVSLVPDAV